MSLYARKVTSDASMTSASRANWIENNAMPDSINKNIMDRSFAPPLAPKVFSSDVGFTWRNTMNILITIKAVTRAFTLMDIARPIRVSRLPQLAVKSWSCMMKHAPAAAAQMPRGSILQLSSG